MAGPDPATPAGARAIQRLETDQVAWLTTVTAAGQPQTMPVWFRWTGSEILVYSHRRAFRNANLAVNPRVSLNLGTDPDGDHVVSSRRSLRVRHDGQREQHGRARRHRVANRIQIRVHGHDVHATAHKIIQTP